MKRILNSPMFQIVSGLVVANIISLLIRFMIGETGINIFEIDKYGKLGLYVTGGVISIWLLLTSVILYCKYTNKVFGVRLTKVVISDYEEQDQLDKESVFVHCK